MSQYVAFFKGLNVGGQHRVKMAALTACFTELGFQHVRSYIQSGNVLFESPLAPATLATTIRQHFTAQFGFDSAVIIRSAAELTALLQRQPFNVDQLTAAAAVNPRQAHVYIYFALTAADVAIVTERIPKTANFKVDGNHCYVFCPEGVSRSPLAQKLGRLPVTLTARNLRTLEQIVARF
ncbi:DUF1697 domain-containing protein [Lactiplantibacillus carotarum]|uniref:DUF1697 domain-containing protein n=1 Tax=Lactiplantibacillus carotarum TaxID=2993456 RepID=UPI00298F3DE8|nr:DUF1697 domain-containing protein [Lactiplantibacillus carotarum]